MSIFKELNDVKLDLSEFEEIPLLEYEQKRILKDAHNKIHPKKQKKKWNGVGVAVVAAACALAIGLTTALNPSFAEWIGGLFTTEIVDQGLHIASENGFTNRINQEVTDKGITFKVEDVLADTSRVALSYQVVKKNGEKLNPQFDYRRDGKNVISAYDQDGNPIEDFGYINASDYGLIEFYLRGHESIDSLTIKFELTELIGTRGNWQLEIPIDLKEIKEMTTKLVLNDQKTSVNGVGIHLKEVQFAPSSTEIMYDTYFTAEEKAKVEAQIQELENAIGNKNNFPFAPIYGTSIQYHIENKDGKTVYRNNIFQDQGHPSDLGLMQGSGEVTEELGYMKWNDSFIPQKEEDQLTFVLDGVIKTVPSDFSIKVNPKELKKHPILFEYEGNFINIKKVDMLTDISLQETSPETEQVLVIEMEGGKEVPSSDLVSWAIVDDKGDVYGDFHQRVHS